MDERIKQAIAAHALAEYPRESCGLIVGTAAGDVYLPGRNIASPPMEQFALAPEDYADAEDMGEILALVHSHPNGAAQPSMGDRAMCERAGIALLGLGSALGIVGSQYLEVLLRRKAKQLFGESKNG
ncbi:C40 family peptidase [Burkholderia diffusa]|uniref:C40 family peptidase n=1 Tax=Burkholderia diffusa TaxID=488732 RepID=UPI003132A544